VKHVVGNHGFESGPDVSALAHEIAVTRPLLAQALAAQGVALMLITQPPEPPFAADAA
jgi:hypothetical protein